MTGVFIKNNQKKEYIKRLGKPYTKNVKCKFFLDQFVAGAGNELSGKFWNAKSSSRFAFDLYSWMAYDKTISDFEFEYHLPGLASGGMGPNMDVYLETRDEVIFIESKFSELANLHYIDNKYLSEAYYTEKEYGKKKLTLLERYYGFAFAQDFSNFCYEIEAAMNENGWHEGDDWFEPKQETCHLAGLLIHLMKNKVRFDGKKVKLHNIYYSMKGDGRSELLEFFESKVTKLIERIKPVFGNISIEFKSFSVQEMLEDNNRLSNGIKFPADICNRIESFTALAEGKTRKDMK